jgi:rhodanese-related sulfurtransferase
LDHSPGFLRLVDQAKKVVREISVDDALRRMREAGATLIDVREDNEWDAAHARGAHHLSKGLIERDIEKTIPDKGSEIFLYCGGGFRSALAAKSLQEMGYTNVWSVAGGWRAWESSGAPVEREDEPIVAPPPV